MRNLLRRQNNHTIIKKSFVLKFLFLTFSLPICYALNEDIGIWIGIGLFFLINLLFKLGNLTENHVPLAHLMALNYFNGLFLFAFLLYFIPADWSVAIRYDRYPGYFSYVIPCCIALYWGVIIATRKIYLSAPQKPHPDIPTPNWIPHAKLLFWTGILFTGIIKIAAAVLPENIAFLLLLIASLRYVGLYILILTGNKNWLRYGLIVLFIEIFIALATGFMHDLVLWGGCSVLILAYHYKWRRKLSAIIFLTYFAIFVLQVTKVEYRLQMWGHDISITQKTGMFTNIFSDIITSGDKLLDKETISNALARFNEGWIIDRVMQSVPDYEPYDYGKTLLTGLYGILVPRIIDPNKPIAGGRKNFEQFTGLPLNPLTSISISVPGEMYANFGLYGGVLGVGIFGYLIGLFYKYLYKKSLENPAWWAWGPFLGFLAIKTSEGLMEILSWIVRGLIVMWIVIFIFDKINRKKTKSIQYPSIK